MARGLWTRSDMTSRAAVSSPGPVAACAPILFFSFSPPCGRSSSGRPPRRGAPTSSSWPATPSTARSATANDDRRHLCARSSSAISASSRRRRRRLRPERRPRQARAGGAPRPRLSPRSGPEMRFVHGRDVVVAAMAGPRVEGPLRSWRPRPAYRPSRRRRVPRPGAARRAGSPPPRDRGGDRGRRGDRVDRHRRPAKDRWIPSRPRSHLPAFLRFCRGTRGPPTCASWAPKPLAPWRAAEGSRVRVEGELKPMERGSTTTWWAGCPAAIPPRLRNRATSRPTSTTWAWRARQLR